MMYFYVRGSNFQHFVFEPCSGVLRLLARLSATYLHDFCSNPFAFAVSGVLRGPRGWAQ